MFSKSMKHRVGTVVAHHEALLLGQNVGLIQWRNVPALCGEQRLLTTLSSTSYSLRCPNEFYQETDKVNIAWFEKRDLLLPVTVLSVFLLGNEVLLGQVLYSKNTFKTYRTSCDRAPARP